MRLPEAVRTLVTSGPLGHLATVGGDGAPHVTCAWFGLDGDRLTMATLFDQRKLRNMRQNPHVAVSFETDVVNEWGLKEYVVLTGEAEVTAGGAPELLQELAHTYIGPDAVFPAMPDPPPGFVTRISVTKVSGVGDWT